MKSWQHLTAIYLPKQVNEKDVIGCRILIKPQPLILSPSHFDVAIGKTLVGSFCDVADFDLLKMMATHEIPFIWSSFYEISTSTDAMWTFNVTTDLYLNEKARDNEVRSC